MKISEEALDEFMRLYKEEFKEDITRAEASEMSFRLLTLYELLARKLPHEQDAPPEEEPRQPIGFRR